MAAADYYAITQQVYISYFGRPADPRGLAAFAAVLDSAKAPTDFVAFNEFYKTNTAVKTLVDSFGTSSESATLYPSSDLDIFVNAIFENVLGRPAKLAGLNYWTSQISSGNVTKAGAALAIMAGAYANTTDPVQAAIDQAVINNKVSVADSFTTAIDTAEELIAYKGAAAAGTARDMLHGITDTTSSTTFAATAAATLSELVNGPVVPEVGSSFTLSTSADIVTGTSSNDTFTALSQATASAATDTLTVVDVINGGAGTDTLNITTNADNTDITDGALITNIEVVNVRAATAATTATLNASSISGLTAVNAAAGAGAVTVTNLAAGASIGIVGNGTVLNGTTTYGYASATGAQVINISGGTTGGAITSSNGTATSVTINSTGADNVVGTIDPVTGTQVTSLTINATTGLEATLNAAYAVTSTLTVTGAGKVTLGGMSTAAFKTIDASAATGAVNVGDIGTVATTYKGSAGVDTVTLNTAVTSATFGAGDDVVTSAAVAATDAGKVDGGTGNDTLVIAAAGDVSTAAKRAVFTSFETLNNATAAAVAADGFGGVSALITSADGGGFTGMTAAQAAAVTVTADQTAVTYALTTATGSADVLSVTLKNGTASASADLAGATITGFETLNVTSSSGNVDETNAAANTVSFTAAANLSAINVAGAYGAYVILDNTAKAVTVSNTLTGTAALKIEGEVIKGSSITTTANGDTIETALASVAGVSGDFVTYNAGAGDDAITTSLTALNNTNNAAASLKIDGGAGTDTLSFATADVSFADASFQYVTGVEKLTVASTTSLNFTTGGFFDNNFKASGVTLTAAGITNGNTATINASSFTGAAKVALTTAADGASSADNVAVTTGTGADTVTVTASSWVGAAGAAGSLAVTTGAGNDIISVTTGTLLAVTGTNAVTVNAGSGADTITAVHVNAGADLGNFSFVIADGDSLAASRDKITGFDLGTAALFSDTLDLQGTPTVTANTAGTDGTNSGSIMSHAITNGVITFDDVDTFASAVVVNEANLSSVLSYLAANITTAGDTVAFAYDSDSSGSADATIVFQQGTNDTVVELVGVLGLSVTATNATTAGLIHLA